MERTCVNVDVVAAVGDDMGITDIVVGDSSQRKNESRTWENTRKILGRNLPRLRNRSRN
ncbi:MAG TPA: hypothetical protein VEG31_04410 [Thermoproteota archaeon]|nr:hypothetical protein [Thermoproteota archaeon]